MINKKIDELDPKKPSTHSNQDRTERHMIESTREANPKKLEAKGKVSQRLGKMGAMGTMKKSAFITHINDFKKKAKLINDSKMDKDSKKLHLKQQLEKMKKFVDKNK